jgi:hypothetical protein
MRRAAVTVIVAGVVLALAIGSRGRAQQDKEKAIPITKEGIAGQWKGKTDDGQEVSLRFGPGFDKKESVTLSIATKSSATGFRGGYEIDAKANVVRLGTLGEARLLEADRLQLTLNPDEKSKIAPKGLKIILNREKEPK